MTPRFQRFAPLLLTSCVIATGQDVSAPVLVPSPNNPVGIEVITPSLTNQSREGLLRNPSYFTDLITPFDARRRLAYTGFLDSLRREELSLDRRTRGEQTILADLSQLPSLTYPGTRSLTSTEPMKDLDRSESQDHEAPGKHTKLLQLNERIASLETKIAESLAAGRMPEASDLEQRAKLVKERNEDAEELGTARAGTQTGTQQAERIRSLETEVKGWQSIRSKLTDRESANLAARSEELARSELESLRRSNSTPL